jgi:hypothetical protein
MADDMPKSKKVTIYYPKADHYRLLPVTGAFGGPTPSGDILAEFFIERKTAPEKMIVEISDGTLNELSREGERHVRELQVGILIRPDVAHAIGVWLIEKAKQFGVGETKQ